MLEQVPFIALNEPSIPPMQKTLFLVLPVLFLLAGCSSSDYGDSRAEITSQIMRRDIHVSQGDIREFHGETWFLISNGMAYYQSPPTYFLERPRNSHELPRLLPGVCKRKRGMTTAELIGIIGSPDFVTADKKQWVYWISDRGSLLGAH